MRPRRWATVVEVDDIEALPIGIDPCRDERCSVDGVHAEHQVYSRGRKIRKCSKCNKQRPCGC